ncbi:hypothetical protein DWB68_11560 [Galactobacter valiniphilus]|uniref:DUF4190 domain-containing protein n=1 Tax=Galactobacter valiniphilus TaxID=2676122 RepID=A0A399J829_9MICC|nr:hypothetical protein [Galactobacter valiniphilus]RII41681.1 hypothetical protein DWB68_11560 [Galactobacter valiniphilus]
MAEQPPSFDAQYPQQPLPQQPLPPQYYPGAPVPPAPRPGNGFGIAALVLGIVALVFCWVPVFGLGLGVLALVLGIVGVLQKQRPHGTSIAGIVMGAVAVVVGVIIMVLAAMVVSKVEEQSNKEFSVAYSATADGQASLSYGSLKGQAEDTFSGTWTKDDKVTGFDGFALTVTSPTGGAVGCEITVDGKSLTKQSGTGSVTCTASTLNP